MTEGPDPDDGFSDAQKRTVLRAVAADLRGDEASEEAEGDAADLRGDEATEEAEGDAADIRGQKASEEAERVAAIVQRVSDLYDPAEETTPKDIYLNMRTILRVTESGGLDR